MLAQGHNQTSLRMSADVDRGGVFERVGSRW